MKVKFNVTYETDETLDSVFDNLTNQLHTAQNNYSTVINNLQPIIYGTKQAKLNAIQKQIDELAKKITPFITEYKIDFNFWAGNLRVKIYMRNGNIHYRVETTYNVSVIEDDLIINVEDYESQGYMGLSYIFNEDGAITHWEENYKNLIQGATRYCELAITSKQSQTEKIIAEFKRTTHNN